MLSLSRCLWGGTLGHDRMPPGAPGKSVGGTIARWHPEGGIAQTRNRGVIAR
jgi:hypothetical protein